MPLHIDYRFEVLLFIIVPPSTLGLFMKDNFNKAIGRNVSTRRKDLQMTQMTLAHEARLDLSFISRLERGVVNSSVESLLRISEVLGCTVRDLIPETNKPTSE
jgi:DNA-binding XRE family transcriptional regulator